MVFAEFLCAVGADSYALGLRLLMLITFVSLGSKMQELFQSVIVVFWRAWNMCGLVLYPLSTNLRNYECTSLN